MSNNFYFLRKLQFLGHWKKIEQKIFVTDKRCQVKMDDRNVVIDFVKLGFQIDVVVLTVALFLGTLVPERSIPSISSRLIMVSKNCPQGLPLKFQGASFGAIKFFWGEIFIGSLTGSGPEITIIIYSSRVFRPNVTYMASC